ncbi:hypothetical protein DM01DRAFT_1013379 [Hesseltinella vesiculosa]|uniref:Uncharacterized protein n=1 Tax=Hesseltinella vesiculosa TaxID=101127 RepID=A0A1X2GYJ7_9FUNG|nr:hypothetical protein DM01DRAFT_1013379 [Hesseltinella vesiculosa]
MQVKLQCMVRTFLWAGEKVAFSSTHMIFDLKENLQNTSKMVTHVFQVIVYGSMLGCLIFDMVVMTTKKLSVADWFWRPGVCFFLLVSADQLVYFFNYLVNMTYWFEACQRDLGSWGPLAISLMVCDLQVHVHSLLSFIFLLRDLAVAVSQGMASFMCHGDNGLKLVSAPHSPIFFFQLK